MPKVMFTISYSIKSEVRDQYLALVREMKEHFRNAGKKNYAVYEARNRRNYFTEVFVTESMEEYDALEDNQDEKTQELVTKLEGFIDGEGMKYSTVVEVD